jgi:hypothetical protein
MCTWDSTYLFWARWWSSCRCKNRQSRSSTTSLRLHPTLNKLGIMILQKPNQNDTSPNCQCHHRSWIMSAAHKCLLYLQAAETQKKCTTIETLVPTWGNGGKHSGENTQEKKEPLWHKKKSWTAKISLGTKTDPTAGECAGFMLIPGGDNEVHAREPWRTKDQLFSPAGEQDYQI